VLVDDLDAPVLRPDDAHHLERVLRVRPGDAVVLGDGAGRWRPARFGSPLEPAGRVEHAAAPEPPIGVAFALVKGGKPELVVQKLTELGVDRIAPFRAVRSVVQWDAARAAKAGERLRAVARAATMQCHRPWSPVVEEVQDFAALVTRPGAALAERSGRPLGLGDALVLVGPEGGWAPEELELARRRGVPRVAAGPHVLRAETASLTIGTLLSTLRAGLVAPVTSAPRE
jgi:16S rRNA (uracil1498-N3)-methyltransferase